MTQLTPIELEDGTVIYIEAQEDIQITEEDISLTEAQQIIPQTTRRQKGINSEQILKQVQNQFKNISKTIHAYTIYSLSAFRKINIAKIDKVTLEFGIKIGGKFGVPYISEGSSDCHLKITVESSFPQSQERELNS